MDSLYLLVGCAVMAVVPPCLALSGSRSISKVKHLAPVTDRRHAKSREPLSQQPLTAPLPPIPERTVLAIMIVGLVFYGGLAALCARNIRKVKEYNRTVWPQELRRWQFTFMCRACGLVFYPLAPAGGGGRREPHESVGWSLRP